MTDKAFSRFFLASMLSLLLALVALGSTTYAWYAASISTSGTLTAACFDISVSVVNAEAELNKEADGSYLLTAEKRYTVTMKRAEHATAENGYCMVIIDGETYYTEPINDTEFIFTIAPTESATVFFIPHIGIGNAAEKIGNGDVLSLNA